MGSNDGSELVKCGSEESVPLDYIMDTLMKNSVLGKETVTFAKNEWDSLHVALNKVQQQLYEMSLLTPVKGAHGLCKVTTCQWNELSVLREKANKDAEKLACMYKMTNELIQLVTKLITENLVAAEGWWHKKFEKLNREIEDLKRQ